MLDKKAIRSGEAQLAARKQLLPFSVFDALGYRVAHLCLEKICFSKCCSTFWFSSLCTNFHHTYNLCFLSEAGFVFINVFGFCLVVFWGQGKN